MGNNQGNTKKKDIPNISAIPVTYTHNETQNSRLRGREVSWQPSRAPSITPTPPSITPRPPSITPRPPSITPRPPSITPTPPSITARPPSITPRPPSITPTPPSITPRPPSITPRPPSITPRPENIAPSNINSTSLKIDANKNSGTSLRYTLPPQQVEKQEPSRLNSPSISSSTSSRNLYPVLPSVNESTALKILQQRVEDLKIKNNEKNTAVLEQKQVVQSNDNRNTRGGQNNTNSRGGNKNNMKNNRGGKNRGRGGNNSNRGENDGPHRGIRGGRGGNRGNRGNQNNRGRNIGACWLPQSQEMDWFNMAPVRGASSQGFTANDLPMRDNYGGRYGNNEDTRSESNQSFNNRGGRGRGRGGRTREPRPEFMGFKKLEEIHQMEPDEIVVGLCSAEAGFDKLLKSKLSADYMVLVIRVISKCCQTTFPQNKAKILARVCENDFVDQLNKYLNEINLHDTHDRNRNKYFWASDNKNIFWKDLLEFYESVIQLIPNTAVEVLPKMLKQTILTVTNLEMVEHIAIPESVKGTLEDIQMKLALCSEEREKKMSKKPKLMQDEEPPDDFRQISLYPMVHEITERGQGVFLRPNIVDGGYRDVDHYLDVHFRLLREDFVAPLRDGICEHLNQQMTRERKRIFNVRFYEKVTFVSKYTVQDKVAVIIQLNMGKRKIKLENTRRFMYGSLLCFTNNNFQSVVYGTVVSRDRNLTEKNQIAVDLVNRNIAYGAPYTMVECSVFFEPYYHVLKALQCMSEDRFPLKRYIIDVEPEVFAPRYLHELATYEHKGLKFNARQTDKWPSAETLGLDHSQYRAFQSALTREFCVIQGPPGTGKTYIGLRIVEVLLKNSDYWSSNHNPMLRPRLRIAQGRLKNSDYWNSNHNPILVICFTNHALDQFLEGICAFTQQLVRIGGQSKNENLKSYNIREMRMKYNRTKNGSKLMYQRRDEIRSIMNEIQRLQKILDEAVNFNRIIDIKGFNLIDERMRNSWFMNATSQELLDWLMGGRSAEERYQERKKQRIAQQNATTAAAAASVAAPDKEHNSDSEDEFFDPDEEAQRELDDFDHVFETYVLSNINSHSLLTQNELVEQINFLAQKLAELNTMAEEANNFVVFDERGMTELAMNKLHEDYDYFNYRMDQLKSGKSPARPLIIDYNNPQLLTPNERWGLYAWWLTLYRDSFLNKLNQLHEQYRQVYQQYEEVKQIEDIKLMRTMHVVGMTTCGAARYQTLLQALKCPIVIVEEAAEVLESHVVVSLTNDCQHLILIGDHKQLRPTTAEFRLRKDCNLDISLFERMVTNNIHCETLEVQHRMRPEIVKLIVPAIYPKLESHASVYTYPPVQGVTKNLFFITHTEAEESVDDSGSRRNIHEAKFLIKLARHFVLQGYEPQDITILAAYSGQMFCLWKERKAVPNLKDVRITGVDNYQGEENKLILLSLVRSNSDSNIGFLRTDNRVNVALSRAKEGLYIIGNMSILEKSDNAWPKIKKILEEDDQIGTSLTLQCQVHRDQLTAVRTAEDFLKVTEGGCTKLCESELNCGHACRSLCHVTDREHLKYKCKENCTRGLCEIGHPCPLKCFQECQPCQVPLAVTLKCGHEHALPCHMNDTSNYQCPTLVLTKLECDHVAEKPCYRNVKKFPCPHPCDVRKLCGHACERRCHVNDDPDHLKSKCFKKCERKSNGCTQTENPHICRLPCYADCMDCEVEVMKTREPCGHVWKVACREPVNEKKCTKRCKNKLNCGHNCKLECWEPCGRCDVVVHKKIESCGHNVKAKCSEPVDRTMCRGKCPRPLACGHPCNKKCNEPCSTSCTELVDNPFSAACGHQFKIPCRLAREGADANDMELLKYCQEACLEVLQCSHPCAGTCGTCAQGRIHATCQEKCGATLICGHECDIPCREICQPCNKKCYYRCTHSKCGKKCGEPCAECKERCTRRCIHGQCTRLCSEPCNVPPCNEPCPKLLRCKHPCIGFCGEPCPPVCRVCNRDDETFVPFFGEEDEPDARFVYLEECKHSIEAGAMVRWVQQEPEPDEGRASEVNVKRCPRCKTIIMTQRYSEYIKEVFRDIIAIKKKVYLEDEENTTQRNDLQTLLANLRHDNLDLYKESKYFESLLKEILADLMETREGKNNPLNKLILHSCTVKIELTERMIEILRKGDLQKWLKHFDFVLMHFIGNESRMSGQKIRDLESEISRFEKRLHLFTIEKNPSFAYALTNEATKSLYSRVHNKLESTEKYSVETDAQVKGYLEELRQLVDKKICISDKERKEIVRAMGLEKGRWFKCPNGHYFAIDQCGGAMEISKCADCGEAIGGQNHALLRTNQFAGEMDGAAHPAWSNAANMNMANYVFD